MIFKTSTVWGNCNPQWNETFDFDIKSIVFGDFFDNTWIEFDVKYDSDSSDKTASIFYFSVFQGSKQAKDQHPTWPIKVGTPSILNQIRSQALGRNEAESEPDDNHQASTG